MKEASAPEKTPKLRIVITRENALERWIRRAVHNSNKMANVVEYYDFRYDSSSLDQILRHPNLGLDGPLISPYKTFSYDRKMLMFSESHKEQRNRQAAREALADFQVKQLDPKRGSIEPFPGVSDDFQPTRSSNFFIVTRSELFQTWIDARSNDPALRKESRGFITVYKGNKEIVDSALPQR